MVAIGCSFEACLMSLTCKYEILENPMSTVGAPTSPRISPDFQKITSSSRARHGAPKANDRLPYYRLLQGACFRSYTGSYTPLRLRVREF